MLENLPCQWRQKEKQGAVAYVGFVFGDTRDEFRLARFRLEQLLLNKPILHAGKNIRARGRPEKLQGQQDEANRQFELVRAEFLATRASKKPEAVHDLNVKQLVEVFSWRGQLGVQVCQHTPSLGSVDGTCFEAHPAVRRVSNRADCTLGQYFRVRRCARKAFAPTQTSQAPQHGHESLEHRLRIEFRACRVQMKVCVECRDAFG
jgi:hypothetical protein